MSDTPHTVSFVASLPPITSAILVSGDGTGARMKIDIPASDADVIPLIQIYFSGKAFRVTLELEDSEEEHEQPNGTIRRTSAKRRK